MAHYVMIDGERIPKKDADKIKAENPKKPASNKQPQEESVDGNISTVQG